MPETPEQGVGKAAPPGDQEAGLAMPIGRNQGSADDSESTNVNDTSDAIKQEAGNWVEEARHQGRRMFNSRKDQMAEQVSGVAQALRQSAEQYQQQGEQQTAGRMLHQAATGLDQLSDVLRKGDVDALLQRTTRLMRQQPALFMGGAVAAGFVLSRFLKSSSEHAHGLGESYTDSLRMESDREFDDDRSDDASATSSEWGE